MRLTWRDGMTTFLAGLTVLIALAVTQAWSWPLLGSYRWGVGVLTIVGLAAGCGYRAATWSVRDPFIWIGSALGVVALGLIVAGLIAGTETLFVALAVDLVALWIVATTHHAVVGVPQTPAQRPMHQT
jgi:hypothetical protein